MTRIHTGRMLDRSPYPRPHMQVQREDGRIVTVRVRDEDRDAAAKHWGGACVPYVYRGGRAYYVPAQNYDRPQDGRIDKTSCLEV